MKPQNSHISPPGSIRLDVPDVAAVKYLLRMAGYVGPWSSRAPLSPAIHCVDKGNLTVISTSAKAGEMLSYVTRTGIDTEVTTATVGRLRPNLPLLLFPMRLAPRYGLDVNGLDDAIAVLYAREDGAPLALAGRHDGAPVLICGFSISEFVRQVRSHYNFFGFGHLVVCVRWFLEKYARAALIRVEPFPDGRPPLLVSFDVEAAVARRSVGSSVFRIPFAGRNLVEINRLQLIRPLVGRRLTYSRNVLRDPDGTFVSRRLIIDRRPERKGCCASRPDVPQWQFHFFIPQRPRAQNSLYEEFRRWAAEHAGPCTHYLCHSAGSLDGLPNEELGFHSVDHRHFHQRARCDLKAELEAAKRTFGSKTAALAVRAPGLLWSNDYFRVLNELDYHIDSSFREVSLYQPLFPIKTDEGFWEFPVTANALHVPDLKRLVDVNQLGGGMISLHCHDHELPTPSERARLKHTLDQLCSAGFAQSGHARLKTWLEQAGRNEICEITVDRQGMCRVHCNLAAGSVARCNGHRIHESSEIGNDLWRANATASFDLQLTGAAS